MSGSLIDSTVVYIVVSSSLSDNTTNLAKGQGLFLKTTIPTSDSDSETPKVYNVYFFKRVLGPSGPFGRVQCCTLKRTPILPGKRGKH